MARIYVSIEAEDIGDFVIEIVLLESEQICAERSLEPALEIWRPVPETGSTARSQVSIWLLIAAVWVSAILLIAGATSAIIYLFR